MEDELTTAAQHPGPDVTEPRAGDADGPGDGIHAAGRGEGRPSDWLRDFHPGWFGAVMGTGAFAVAASLNPGQVAAFVSPARTFSQTMAAVTGVMAAVLIGPYLARFVRHGDAALTDLRSPLRGAQFATLPAAILVLALTATAVGPTWWSAATVRDLVAAFAWLGVPLTFVTGIYFAYLLFVSEQMTHEDITGRWFIPPVAAIVIPLVLAPLMPGDSPVVARTLLLASYGFWGMGFLLYVLVATTLHHRLVGRPAPHAHLAPSWMIGLGPVAVAGLALVKMASVGAVLFRSLAPAVGLLSRLAATALWGFGVWWLIAAVGMLVVHYLRHGRIPYEVGWWGFIFPLGAFTILTVNLAKAWGLPWLQWVGAALFVLLGLFWLFVAGWTVWAMRTGQAWRRPQ